jgi:hypothetical protein
MPIPTNRTELLATNSNGFENLNRLLDSLSEVQMQVLFQFPHRDRNVRDVLAHLLEWQNLFFGWYKVGMSGGDPVMPCKGFSWKETPELNLEIWKNCQSLALAQVRSKLTRSHNKLQKLVEKHSDEELFTKKFYHWTGSTSLGVYFRGAACSHYVWALKLLRKCRW